MARDGAARHGRRPRDGRRGRRATPTRKRTRRRSLRPPSSPRRSAAPRRGHSPADAPGKTPSRHGTTGRPDRRLEERQDDAPLGLRASQVAARRVRHGPAPMAEPGGRIPKRTRAREGAPAPASPGHGHGRGQRRSRRGGGRAGHGPTRPWPRTSPRAPRAVTALPAGPAGQGGAADATGNRRAPRHTNNGCTSSPSGAGTAALDPAPRREDRQPRRHVPGTWRHERPHQRRPIRAPRHDRCARPPPPPPPGGRRSPDRSRRRPCRPRRRAAGGHGQGSRTRARHGTQRSRERAPA